MEATCCPFSMALYSISFIAEIASPEGTERSTCKKDL